MLQQSKRYSELESQRIVRCCAVRYRSLCYINVSFRLSRARPAAASFCDTVWAIGLSIYEMRDRNCLGLYIQGPVRSLKCSGRLGQAVPAHAGIWCVRPLWKKMSPVGQGDAEETEHSSQEQRQPLQCVDPHFSAHVARPVRPSRWLWLNCAGSKRDLITVLDYHLNIVRPVRVFWSERATSTKIEFGAI